VARTWATSGVPVGYQTHDAVDGGKQRIILGVLVAPGEVMEHQPLLDQAWHVRFRFHVHPRQATGDTKYGTLANIRALDAMDMDVRQRADMPLFDAWNRHPDSVGPAQFTYDAEQDVYRCPQGQLLRPVRREYRAQKTEYRANAATCNACPEKPTCTPGTQGRIVHRSFHAAVQERVRAYPQTPAAYVCEGLAQAPGLGRAALWRRQAMAKMGMACAASASVGAGA
jgi:hypothetical protein